MAEIKCPNCGEVFQIDESSYESIVKQVRDHTFNEELKRREEELKKDKQYSLELMKSQQETKLQDLISKKEMEISALKTQIENAKINEEMAVNKALAREKEESYKKDALINELKNDLSAKDKDAKIALNEALNKKDQQIMELRNKLEMADTLHENSKAQMRSEFEMQLKAKQDEVDFYKDYKAKQSTKMIGESLEVHCATEFNKLRPLFPFAYFDKDNEVSKSSGSKGDFIFRDYDEEGTEIVSIMFEMKNEADTTASKHKNEDFLKELDKDRNEKKCEYAVLVSLLEQDSELYNSGIVDVSYRYPKMYVVRPQFFIPIITLIRNGALSSLSYKKQLIVAQNQDVDLANFEANINEFKAKFDVNYNRASEKFKTAIEEIDKSISHLEKIKDALKSSENQLRLANNKAQDDLTVKKLTKNAPSIATKLKELKENE